MSGDSTNTSGSRGDGSSGEDVTAMLKEELFPEIVDAITDELSEYNKDNFREAA